MDIKAKKDLNNCIEAYKNNTSYDGTFFSYIEDTKTFCLFDDFGDLVDFISIEDVNTLYFTMDRNYPGETSEFVEVINTIISSLQEKHKTTRITYHEKDECHYLGCESDPFLIQLTSDDGLYIIRLR